MAKRHWFGICFGLLWATTLLQISYFSAHNTLSQHAIQRIHAAIVCIGLPDLSLATEAHYMRHRSLSAPFAFFNEGPSLYEYFPSSFVYAYSPLLHSIPSRIEPDHAVQ